MRFRLLLLASACVLGGARPRDDLSEASLKGARTFSEKPGAEPVALLGGRIVILKPSGVAFRIPRPWLDHYDSPPKYPVENSREMVSDPADLDRYYAPKNNLHFTRQELDQVKSGQGNEWDEMFATVINELLPFEQCIVHGGGEGWGMQGHSFGDVQMRVYLGRWDLVEIQKLVRELALPAVRKLSQDSGAAFRSNAAQLRGFADMTGGFSAGGASNRSATAGWQIESLTFPMVFFDYGATAAIDFYVRKYREATVVIIFMYTTIPRGQEAEIQSVVTSFRITER
jgi:hypothetical protein